jgi:DNA-binding IclR family transcriptional regulator
MGEDQQVEVAQPLGAGSADIQAVSRVAQILGLFSNGTPELSVATAAADLGLNRTTVHRYFASMTGAGLLHRADEAGMFAPGRLAIQLGAFALGRRTVVDLAERHLRELSEATRMTAVLSLWGALGAVVTRVHENRSGAVLITVPVGTQLSLDTAQSVLYLAYLPDQLAMQRLRAALPPATQRSIALRIDLVRRHGLSTSIFEDGISSIAAPIFGPNRIVASLALVHTSSMLSTDTESAEALRLRATAAELSAEMGYLDSATGTDGEFGGQA